MKRLTLIGMPGSGKSAVGRIIAGRLGWHFLDTDKVMEEEHGTPLQTLVERVGEEAFRRVEEETILKLAVPEHSVISTGGSVVYSDPAMRHLRAISTVVFLDATLEAIRLHIHSEAPRGIVGMPEGGLEELYQQRIAAYRSNAEITVALTSETLEEAADLVISKTSVKLQTS